MGGGEGGSPELGLGALDAKKNQQWRLRSSLCAGGTSAVGRGVPEATWERLRG